MRQLCFADPAMRKRLEAILHPLIRSESVARCQRAEHAPYVLLVVPLLIESGAYREHIDRILVVDCDEAQQVARVIARSGLSEEEVRDFCKGQIAHYKVPRYIRFVQAFPMTVTGKIQKFKIRDEMIELLDLRVIKTA